MDAETLELADQMLAEMGLSPVTVPGVLNGNRVPDWSQSRSFEQVEAYLLEQGFVNEIKRTEADLAPGDWRLFQISEAGYVVVQTGLKISEYLAKQQRESDQRQLTYAREREQKREARQAAIDAGLLPQWWIDGNGEWLVGDFDPEEEKPLWWAKYRLRRIGDQIPDYYYYRASSPQYTFPEKWWEKIVDFLLRHPRTIFQVTLVLLLLVGLIYVSWPSP